MKKIITKLMILTFFLSIYNLQGVTGEFFKRKAGSETAWETVEKEISNYTMLWFNDEIGKWMNFNSKNICNHYIADESLNLSYNPQNLTEDNLKDEERYCVNRINSVLPSNTEIEGFKWDSEENTPAIKCLFVSSYNEAPSEDFWNDNIQFGLADNYYFTDDDGFFKIKRSEIYFKDRPAWYEAGYHWQIKFLKNENKQNYKYYRDYTPLYTETIMTHEFGHAIGIGHIDSNLSTQSIMYKTYDYNDAIFQFKALDKTAARMLYSPNPLPTDDNPQLPEVALSNYPNPFKISGANRDFGTTISYNLAKQVKEPKIEIFNIRGQRVKSYKLEEKSGKNEIVWKGKDVC